ncbi:MAG: tRNA pseudouridine(55) synthase TruB, partial [Beijerinckiaceae bacterium]
KPNDPRARGQKNSGQFRAKKRNVHGWVILDKPVGMTSTHAVSVVKRLYQARKAGHAGTLDPLASGCLPIALGEATKTVPFVMDGDKSYRFTARWGSETDTDDSEGRVTVTSPDRPSRDAIAALLPRFTGVIQQTPPKYSAIKIAGERAYDLARDGEDVQLQPREVVIDTLSLVEHGPDATVFEMQCGKGAYVRAIARDLGRALGCYGHVTALRRTRVGPFDEATFSPVASLMIDGGAPDEAAIAQALRPAEIALSQIPRIDVQRGDAGRLMRGQGVLWRGQHPLAEGEPVAIFAAGDLIAIGDVEKGELRPRRVFRFEP